MRVILQPAELWGIAAAVARGGASPGRDLTGMARVAPGWVPDAADLLVSAALRPHTARATAPARPASAPEWSGAAPETYVQARRSGPAPRAPETHVQARRSTPAQRALPQGMRLLLPPPGRKRTVRFGEGHALLAGQLAAPQRLRPSHRLSCYVQICEALLPQRFHVLEATFRAALGAAPVVAPLDEGVAELLGVPQRLRGRPSNAIWREPDMVLPGERFVALRLSVDPTAEAGPGALAPAQPGPAALPAAGAPLRAPPAAGAQESAQASRSNAERAERTSPATGESGAGRRTIPVRYLQPWELVLGREQALEDMRRARRVGAVRALLARLARRPGRAVRLSRWRESLYGRTADDQLWGVRPPERGYLEGEVLRWAERMLGVAGYDAARWLPEWELFWRQKGV